MNNNLLVQASVSPEIKFEMLQVQVVCKFKINSLKVLNENSSISEPSEVKYLWYYSDFIDDDLLDTLIVSKKIVFVGALSECKNRIIVKSDKHFYLVD